MESIPSKEADGNVQRINFGMSDLYLDIDRVDTCAEEISPCRPEIIYGFRDFKEEFDFKVRSRWRRPSFIAGLFGDDVPTTNRIDSMAMAEDGNFFEFDNGLSKAAAISTNTSGLIDGGANGGLANPMEMKFIFYAEQTTLVSPQAPAAAAASTKTGTYTSQVQLRQGRCVLMIFHEYGEFPSALIADLFGDNIPSTKRIVSMVMLDNNIEGELDHGFSMDHSISYQASTGLSVNIAGIIGVGLITDEHGEPGCIKWGDREDFMFSSLVRVKDIGKVVVLPLSGTSFMLSCGVPLLAACVSGFHPSVILFGTRINADSSGDRNHSALQLCLRSHDMNDLLMTMLSWNTCVQLLRTSFIRKLHALDFGENRHFAHSRHPSSSLVFQLLSNDTRVIHAMNRGVIAFHRGGLIRSHRCWHIFAQQLRFIHQLIVAWGDILPSTIALLKPTRYHKINGEYFSVVVMTQDFIDSALLRYWKENGELFLHLCDKTRRLYYHRIGHNYLSVGEYQRDLSSHPLFWGLFGGSQGSAAQVYSCSRQDIAAQFSITVTCMLHRPSSEDIIPEGTIISEHGEMLIHRLYYVIRPWGDYSSCTSYILFCKKGGYILLARKHQSSDYSPYKFLVVSITQSNVKSSVIEYLSRILDFTSIGNDSIIRTLCESIYKIVCSEHPRDCIVFDIIQVSGRQDFSATHDITNYFLDNAQVMITSEDGENFYCVSCTKLDDLTSIISTNYFDTDSSSVELARVYFGAVLRITAVAITSAIGNYLHTVGTATLCALWNHGEPIIYFPRDCAHVRCVNCELHCPASYGLHHVYDHVYVKYAEDAQAARTDTTSLNFLRCHQINVGRSFKSSITPSRCNYSNAFLIESFIGTTTARDIVSFRYSEGSHHQLQLKVQVQVTSSQQVQLTSDMPFSNGHIIPSFGSSDIPTTVVNINIAHHHCNPVHPEDNQTTYERVDLREPTTIVAEGEVDGITDRRLLRRQSEENVGTNYGEKLFRMVISFAGWGVLRRGENDIWNASAFAPYLGVIVSWIGKMGASVLQYFTKRHQMKLLRYARYYWQQTVRISLNGGN